MTKADFYSKNQIEKLGNALIFLCEKMIAAGESVSKTHLLKLIFIIEEISVKKYGLPFFDLRFDVWKLGPVSKDLYYELSEEPTLLSEYINIKTIDGNTIVEPKKAFSDDEFNDNEIALIEQISERFLFCTAKELINYTHKKDSPWYQTAYKHGVLELLESGAKTTTDIEIKLCETIENDKEKLAIYLSHKDFLAQTKTLKS